MNISVRLFFGYFLVVGLAAWFVLYTFVKESEPSIRQATEESLVDSANLLAELAAGELAAGRLDWRILALLFAGAGLFAALAWLPRRLRRNRPDALPVPGEDEAETEE